MSHNPKTTWQKALEYFRRVAEKCELNIHLYEEIKDVSRKDEGFAVKTTGGIYQTR